MQDDRSRARRARLAPREGRVGLIWRLMIALVASAAAGIGVDRLLADLITEAPLRGAVAAGASATLVGLALWVLVVLPLSRSRADLHRRYETALADSLSDPLTGLGNHRAFQEELTRQVEAAQRYGVPLALAIIDLDEFKQVNDGSGHAEGDRTLSHFGDLMTTAIRRVDRAFRIGGDEFAVLLPHTDAEGAHTVIRRVLASSLQPARRRGGEEAPLVSFSAGISALPALATTRAELYSQADTALYQAKHAGRTMAVVFDPTSEPAIMNPEDGHAIAEVIARTQLRPVYQPIVDLESGVVLGVEGLIRPVAPAPFADPGALFGAAASSGHTVSLDLTCFEVIVRGARRLAAGQFLSINLSPTTVQAAEFGAAVLLSILSRHHFSPERVVLELTEREEVTDTKLVRERLEACRRAGMRLAADDVGAGNAGLRLLSEMQFDIIKVDLGLVRRSAASATSSAVVESVVALAGRTGAMVVGEGIEEEGQVTQLAALGVRAGQGYHLGRPAPLVSEDRIPDSDGSPIAAAAHGTAQTAVAPTPVSIGEDELPSMEDWRRSLGLPIG